MSWSSPDVIKEKGLEHVTVDDLVAEITPKGRGKKMQTWMWSYINKHTFLYFINILKAALWTCLCWIQGKNVNSLILTTNKTCEFVLCNRHSKSIKSCVCRLLLQVTLFSHESVFIFIIDLMVPRKLGLWGRDVLKFQFFLRWKICTNSTSVMGSGKRKAHSVQIQKNAVS